MSEYHGTKMTCPHCNRACTARTTVAEGTKVKCPGCGKVYEYQPHYDVDAPPDPPPPEAKDTSPPTLPPAPRPKFKWPKRPNFTVLLLRLPGWLCITTGILQFCEKSGVSSSFLPEKTN